MKKALVVKGWFAGKIEAEKGVRFSMLTGAPKIYGILKETEKAYYALIIGEGMRPVWSWVPKSVTEENAEDEEETLDFTEFDYEYMTAQYQGYKAAYC